MKSCQLFSTIILFFSFSILIAQDPPANNTYQTAATLTVQAQSCSSQTQGDLTHATNSNGSDYSGNCLDDYYGAHAYADVWFKATVPSSGKLTIETSEVSGSVLDDTVLVAYTLSEGTLTEIDCNDDRGSSQFFSRVELSDQTENEEIYVMVTEYNNGYDGSKDEIGPFNICAYDPGTLDLSQTQKPLLSYNSNPVGNRLRVESPYNIQSLEVYDLVGREVLTKSPQKQKLTLDTYSLAPGVYFLNVQTAEG